MTTNLARRNLLKWGFVAPIAGVLAAAGAQKSLSETKAGHSEVEVLSWEPYERWLGKRVKSVEVESVELPWNDTVRGGADPYMVMASDETIYATTASFPKLVKSSDGGRTWTVADIKLTPPIESDPKANVQNFGILRSDTLIIGYQLGKQYYVSCSEDRGKTWQPSVAINSSPYQSAGGTTRGTMVELPNGTVLLPVTCYWEDQQSAATQLRIYRSKDGGKTWGDKSPVCFWGYEPGLLRLRSGGLMIAVRYQRCEGGACVLPSDPPEMAESYVDGYPKDVYIARSDDGGYQWRNWQRVTTGDFDVPGQLLQLSDGRLLLLYAHRAPDPSPCGTWAMVSRDEGRNWERNRYIVNGICHRPKDWGYSASLVLREGWILTLSGCRGDGWPDRPDLNQKEPGRILAIRWRPE